MDLGAYLKEKGIRVNHFARECGVAPDTISRIKGGEKPCWDLAFQIVARTGGMVTLKDLGRSLPRGIELRLQP